MSVRNILQVGERVLFNACSLVVVCYVKFKNISNTFGRIAVSQDSFIQVIVQVYLVTDPNHSMQKA